jgi:hypothetical protein
MHRIIGFDQSRRHRFRTRGKPEADLRAATCARGIFMPDSWIRVYQNRNGYPFLLVSTLQSSLSSAAAQLVEHKTPAARDRKLYKQESRALAIIGLGNSPSLRES